MDGFSAIGLHCPQNPINVGGVLRASFCYNVSLIVAERPQKKFSKTPTDTHKAYRHLPFIITEHSLRDYIPFDCVPVGVDLVENATPLQTYQHPERAFYVFGAENETLGKKVLSWCRDTVYIPTNGCMNLASTVNVVLYDRLQKQGV